MLSGFITAAGAYRVFDENSPTLFMDDVDTTINAHFKYLMRVLSIGNRRGLDIVTTGRGSFSTFGLKVIVFKDVLHAIPLLGGNLVMNLAPAPDTWSRKLIDRGAISNVNGNINEFSEIIRGTVLQNVAAGVFPKYGVSL